MRSLLFISILFASVSLYAQEDVIESVENDRIIDTAAFRNFIITEAFYLTETDTSDLYESENKDLRDAGERKYQAGS